MALLVTWMARIANSSCCVPLIRMTAVCTHSWAECDGENSSNTVAPSKSSLRYGHWRNWARLWQGRRAKVVPLMTSSV
ncbi:hypothetical protein BD413DRAFT_595568 [Trametes elegans]|nr:hypothetical protein BD413DRAFT_595568 [Trametes elegans]